MVSMSLGKWSCGAVVFRFTKANGRVDRVQLNWLLHIMKMRLVIMTGHKIYL